MVATVCWLAGCHGGSSVDFSPFEGLYRLDSYTLNANGCDAEGPAVSGADPMLVVFSFFAANVGSFAEADSCADAAACRQRAAHPVPSVAAAGCFGAHFTAVTADGQGLAGTSFSQDLDGTIAQVINHALRKSANGIHIASRIYELPCQTRDGKCDQSATVAVTATAPCHELRAVTATFLERL